MATAEMAAMLDELMGRNRNAGPNEKVEDITWEDESVCKYYLVDFCPHDVFTNTKVDLGSCTKIHNDDFKEEYKKAKESSRKTAAEDEFIRFCQKMINDLGHKIRRSKERLVLTQMEQAANNGVSPQQQEEIEEKITLLTDKINGLVEKAEKAGFDGDVEEAQGVLKLCDQLREERNQLKTQIGIRQPGDPFGPPKAMEVCETCGAFLIVGDAQSRIDDHNAGKQHAGFTKLKESLDAIFEARRKRREEREKEREQLAEERKKRRDDDKSDEKDADRKRTRSRSKDRRSHDRKRSRSRDRRRSRSRDRKRRSRSRDRRRRSRSSSRDRRRDRDRRR